MSSLRSYAKMLNDRYFFVRKAIWANPMRWFGSASIWLQDVGKRSPSKTFQFVSLLLSFPCFKISHFFFKRAYAFNQRRLRFLCGKDLALQVNDRPIPDGGIVHVLYGLRQIKHGLEGANPSKNLSDHKPSPISPSSKVSYAPIVS